MAKNAVKRVVDGDKPKFGTKTTSGPEANAVVTPSGANDAILNAQIDRLVETLSNNIANVVSTVICGNPAKTVQDLKPSNLVNLEKTLETVFNKQTSSKSSTGQTVTVMLASADTSLSEVLGNILGASPDGLQSLDAIIKQLDELRISVKDEIAIESITHLQNVLNLLFNTPYSSDNIGAVTDGILNIERAIKLLNEEFDEKSIGVLTDTLYELSTCLATISASFDGAENIAAAMNSFFALLNIDEKKLENVDIVVENFNKFTLIKFDEIKEKIIELTPHLEKLKDLINEIKSLFGENISSCAEAIKANTGNIAKITDGINKTQEQVVNGVLSMNQAEIKAAADNIGSIAALITLGGAMMLLGGWILQKNPDLINGSMQFGLVLATFLLFILTPITLAAVVAGKMGGTFKDFDKIVDFIWVGATVMTLGALICLIPGIAKSSLEFSKLLAVFLFSILLPVSVLVAISGLVDSGTETMQDLSVFIATCAIVMTIGALFTLIPNFGNAAIGFGKVFFAFLMELIMPFALIAIISNFADGGALESLSNFIVKVAAVMTIGGLFVLMGGGKFAAAAIAFGGVFGAFLLSFAYALAIASLLTVFGWALDNVTDLIVRCSIIMTIGALFMLIGGGKFAAAALGFGVILSVFIALMLLPLGLLANDPFFWKSAIIMWVFKGFVVQLSFILLLGGLLVATQPKIILGSILFGLLTYAYVVLMLSVVKLITTGFTMADAVMLSAFKSFIVGLALILMVGGLLMLIPGFGLNTLLFAGLVTVFVLAMIGVFKLIAKINTAKQMQNILTFAYAVAVLGVTLMLGALVTQEAGWENAGIFAGVLFGFTLLSLLSLKLLSKNTATIAKGAAAAVIFGVALGLIGGTLLLFAVAAKMLDGVGDQGFIATAVILGVLVAMVVALGFALPAIGVGVGAAIVLGLALASIAGALMLFSFTVKMWAEYEFSDVTHLCAIVGALAILFVTLAASTVAFALGAVAAGLLSAALLPLSLSLGALGLVLKMNITVEQIQNFGNVLAEIETMFDKLPGGPKLVKAALKGWALLAAVTPLVLATAGMLNIIKQIGSAKLPIGFDKNGNPTGYEKINDINAEIGKATNFIGAVFRAIPEMFNSKGEGDVIPSRRDLANACVNGLLLATATRPLINTISNMVNIITQIASAKIPEGFDENGKPIGYRTLDIPGDINNASEFVGKIFTAIPDMLKTAPTYKQLWDMCWKGVTLSLATRPLISVVRNMIDIITQIGSAKLPTGFDEEGKATGYKKIDNINAEVGNAAEFIKKVFLAIPDILNADGFPTYKQLWDMCWRATDLNEAISPLINVVKGTIDMITQIGNAKIPEGFKPDGTVTSYRKIVLKDDIANASDFIKEVFEAFPDIVGAVIDVAGTTSFKRLTKKISNFGNVVNPVITTINSMVNVIKNLAEMRIPTGYDKDGNVTGYKPFKFEEDSVKVTTAITNIVTCLSTAINEVYTKNSTLINNMDHCEAVVKIIEGMKGIADFLGSMKDTITAYADLRFPIYGSDGKPKRYESFDANGIQGRVQTNITSLLTLLSTTMINAMNDENVKNLLKTETLDKFNSFTEAMKNVNEVLKSASEGYSGIDFSKISKEKIEKNMPTITSLTSKLPATLYDSINYIETVKKVTIVALTTKLKDFKEIFTPINETFNGISAIVNNKAFKNFNKTYEDQITKIGDFLTLLNSFIIESIYETQSLTKSKLKNYNDTIVALHDIIVNIGSLSKIVEGFDISTTTLNNVYYSARFIEGIWVDLLSHIRELETNYPFDIIKFYNEETLYGIFHLFVGIRHIKGIVDSMDYDTLKTLNKADNTEEFIKKISNILTVIAEIDDISGPRMLKRYNKDFAEIIDLSNQIGYLKNIIDGFEYDNAIFDKLSSTYQFISAVKGLLFSMGDISTKTVEEKKFWGLITFNRKEKLDFKDLITDLSNYLLSAKIIKQVVDTIKSVPTVEEELSFTYVLHKITEVGDSISENTIQKIDKEADAVNKYIKTVNSVNIKAVDSVTRLVHEMNNLQEKSLNKFADAIANKLTVALNNLSKEINDADKSLAKADELREKRINAINKSIEKIQGIMAQTINIRVNGNVDDTEIDEDPKG